MALSRENPHSSFPCFDVNSRYENNIRNDLEKFHSFNSCIPFLDQLFSRRHAGGAGITLLYPCLVVYWSVQPGLLLALRNRRNVKGEITGGGSFYLRMRKGFFRWERDKKMPRQSEGGTLSEALLFYLDLPLWQEVGMGEKYYLFSPFKKLFLRDL